MRSKVATKPDKKLLKLAKKGNCGLGSKEPHKCCLCKHVSKNFACLKVHLKSVHGQAPKMFCDLCSRTYYDKDRIKAHMKVHIKAYFACNVCDYETHSKKNLRKHKLRHGLKVLCKICNKLVTSLSAHMIYHAPKETCRICKKDYKQAYIKTHIKRHKRDMFKCKDCGEIFAIYEDLRRFISSNFFPKFTQT